MTTMLAHQFNYILIARFCRIVQWRQADVIFRVEIGSVGQQ